MLLAANHSYEQLSRCEADEVIRLYDSSAKKGLSKEDIQQRLKQFGPNIFRIAKKKSEWLELLSHFKSPLIIILLAASIISFSLSETINATIIIAIVLVSVIIDYLQEKDARNAAEKLKQTVKTRVTVLRNETEKEITQEELCPGDIILLNAGKMVPADARVFFAKDFTSVDRVGSFAGPVTNGLASWSRSRLPLALRGFCWPTSCTSLPRAFRTGWRPASRDCTP